MFAKGLVRNKLWEVVKAKIYVNLMSNCRIILVNSKDAYTHLSICYYCKENLELRTLDNEYLMYCKKNNKSSVWDNRF